jgi:hypothetical protein
MTLKLILEANGRRQVLSLDALAEPFLHAIQAAVRQEVQRILPSGSTPALPEEKKSEAVRPVALSKAKAANALGCERSDSRLLHRSTENPRPAHWPARSRPHEQHRGSSQTRCSGNPAQRAVYYARRIVSRLVNAIRSYRLNPNKGM